MAREIRGVASSGSTVYARIINRSGLWWNGTDLEAYSAPDWANYAVTMTEQGVSGVFTADFPTAILVSGTYEYYVHVQAGGSPAEGDQVVSTGTVDWTGQAAATSVSGSMTGSDFYDYFLRKGFMRTDKSAMVYEAITDAIQELRTVFGFDEAKVDEETTDAISVLGDFKLDIESNLGLIIGLILQDGTIATPLIKLSKSQFDELYSDINVTTDRGYPLHYCIYGGEILIGPIPDRITFTYRISYSTRAGTVTASTTSVPFTSIYRELLATLTNSFAYEAMEDFDKAAYYRSKFESLFPRMTRREKINSGESGLIQKMIDF